MIHDIKPRENQSSQKLIYLRYFKTLSIFLLTINYAPPSFTCTISVGCVVISLGITFIRKLHNDALLPFLIIPCLKSENG